MSFIKMLNASWTSKKVYLRHCSNVACSFLCIKMKVLSSYIFVDWIRALHTFKECKTDLFPIMKQTHFIVAISNETCSACSITFNYIFFQIMLSIIILVVYNVVCYLHWYQVFALNYNLLQTNELYYSNEEILECITEK